LTDFTSELKQDHTCPDVYSMHAFKEISPSFHPYNVIQILIKSSQLKEEKSGSVSGCS